MIALAVVTGAFVITNLSMSSRMAERTDRLHGLLVHYLFGFFGALPLIVFDLVPTGSGWLDIPPWALTGGLLGIMVILLSNHALPRITAFEMTILVFIGQMLTGLGIDYLNGDALDPLQIVGYLIVLLGLVVFSGRLVPAAFRK